MDLGVLEGQTSRGLFSNSNFDPSVIGARLHSPFYCMVPNIRILEFVTKHQGIQIFWYYERQKEKQTEVEALLHLGLVCHPTYNPARDQTRRALMTFCGRFWAAFTNGELAEVSIPYCGTAKLSRLLLYYNVHTLLWDSRP